jgi:hypothetical protein
MYNDDLLTYLTWSLFSRFTSYTSVLISTERIYSPAQIVLWSNDPRLDQCPLVDHTIPRTRRNNAVQP